MAIIPYADVIDRKLLPVDAQEIVTRVRLVIAGDMAGATPPQLRASLMSDHPPTPAATLAYAPLPITHVYEAPEHATYGAEKSFALPSGVNPFLPPTDPLIPDPIGYQFVNPGAPSAVRDGDPLTYATLSAPNFAGARLEYAREDLTVPVYGWRLVYSLLRGNRAIVAFETSQALDAPSPHSVSFRLWTLDEQPATFDDVVNEGNLSATTERYMVAPHPAQYAAVNTPPFPFDGAPTARLWLATGLPDAVMRVYHFYPLMLNEPYLDDVARAQVRLPALLPQRVTVRGYVAPDREHTITGWPGGDYTGVVAQHQYDLGRTVIDFEQAGSPVGLPAEAIEAARERRQVIDGTIATANYNLMMGSRR